MRSTHARVRTSAALHASLLSASAAPSQSCASMTQCSSSASRDPVARQGRCLLDHGATYLPAAGVKASSMMGTAASTKQTGGVALLGGVYTSVEWQPACWGREVLLVTLSSRSTRTRRWPVVACEKCSSRVQGRFDRLAAWACCLQRLLDESNATIENQEVAPEAAAVRPCYT